MYHPLQLAMVKYLSGFEGPRELPRGLVAFFSWMVVGAMVKVLAVSQVIVLGSNESFFVCTSE